ncbi:RDD family protein [Marivita sp. GX14005]|uniref:RDD family protein n=1 Tax=Marivita sp. GX14005 TaxID=2942276 RepID=UPI002019965F|nr:RDD family protein [Marivita sp. GX14005]MCL3882475.1 RDD family protein [Marivita sp. GX14005]
MYAAQSPGFLPDPVLQPEFYDSVLFKRALAWVVDVAVIVILLVPVVVLTAFIGLFFLPFLYLVVGFLYRTATLANGSATWGMRLMAIELRDAQGQRLDTVQALLHVSGYLLSISVFPLQLVSIAMMLLTERRQGLTDMLLGTAMINRRA